MNPNFERALLLYQQSRHELAEEQLHQALANEPGDTYAHALLALCLLEREQFKDATAEAEQAIHLAPDFGFAHYAQARVLKNRNHHPQAFSAIREAIRLDSTNADYFALKASIELEERRWNDALISAEEGLQFDPGHVGCTNLRAMAMVKLGRRTEAGATIDAALARQPENSLTHANQGWTLLHKGDPKKALEHFRESLRLDPTNEWARRGVVEALQARNFVYAIMLKYFLWTSRLSRRAQWMVILAGYLANQLLDRMRRENPDLARYILPLQVVYVTFVVLTWTAPSFFNLLLRLNKFGRMVLLPEQVMVSSFFGLSLLLALGALGMCLVRGFDSPWIMGLVIYGLLLLPIGSILKCYPGWPRITMICLAAGLALIGSIAAVLLCASADNSPFQPAGFTCAGISILGAVASTWIANILAMQRPQR